MEHPSFKVVCNGALRSFATVGSTSEKGLVMATAIDSVTACAIRAPASRRFYIHVGSLGFLVSAQPSFFGEVSHALALSGASRALDQVVEDWTMFSSSDMEPALPKSAEMLQHYTQVLVDALLPTITDHPEQWFQFAPLDVPAESNAPAK